MGSWDLYQEMQGETTKLQSRQWLKSRHPKVAGETEASRDSKPKGAENSVNL